MALMLELNQQNRMEIYQKDAFQCFEQNQN